VIEHSGEWTAELPYLGVAQGEAQVRQVLRGGGPFTEVWRGRWQADHGMDQEGIVLIRVMLEHTIMLHWIVARGDDGIDAMHANQSKQMTRTFDRARGTAMEVPEAIAGEITASFDAIDATKAASNFSNICREVGCGDLYWVYGILSESVHPSVFTGNAYIEPRRRLGMPRYGYRPPNAAAPAFRTLVTKSDPLPLATCCTRATSASSTGMAYSATVCACSR
jgi:hypothetical protein